MDRDRLELVARACALLGAGHSYGSAAEVLGCSRSQVQRYADSARVLAAQAAKHARLVALIDAARTADG